MSGDKGIIHCLIRFREAGDAAELTERVQLITPPGNDFMRVTLMTDIKDDAVVLRIIHAVECHRQFHRAQIRGEMSARLGNGLNQEGSDFLAQNRQLFCI